VKMAYQKAAKDERKEFLQKRLLILLFGFGKNSLLRISKWVKTKNVLLNDEMNVGYINM